MERFGKNLQARANALGLSNAAVARSLNLNERRYSHYVTGKREPDLSTLVRIAAALGTTTDQLLGLANTDTDGTQRSTVLDRLMIAAKGLEQSDLEAIAVQVEALLALRKFKSSTDDKQSGQTP